MHLFQKLLMLLMCVLLTMSCKKTTKPVEDTLAEENLSRKSQQRPKETISLRRAHEMYKAYQARFDAITALRNGKEDASYGWHSLEFYRDYIAYLEAEAKKVNIRISGLRLYYVAYPDDEVSGDHRGYQTYIFVPTYFDKEKGEHIAFDPLHMDDNNKPLPIHDVITTGRGLDTKNKDARELRTAAAEELSSVANMGEMCKPNCAR